MSKSVSEVADQEAASQDSNTISERQALIYRLKSIAHSQFPRLFSHPADARRLEIHRLHDPKKNAQTTPPVDELIDISCVWGVEYYTPRHVESLLTNLKRLKWDSSDHDLGTSDPIAWISRSRQHHFGSGWLNIGVIYSRTDDIYDPFRRTAPLPPHVEYATGGLYSLTPSLFCIVMGFVFEEDYCAQFDKALRTDRQTYTHAYKKSSTRRYRIYGPETQKSDHIRRIRAEMVGLAKDWFQEHLPGLFSSGLLGGELPTCELVTLRKAEPFAPRKGNGLSSYLSVLDLHPHWDDVYWKKWTRDSLNRRV